MQFMRAGLLLISEMQEIHLIFECDMKTYSHPPRTIFKR
jgi:hypothetical protein